MERLIKIQSELKAPKAQRNNFGKYNYRNCEDILEAVKPLLKEYGLLLTISDEIKEGAGIMYVEATATLSGLGKNEFGNNLELSIATVKAQAGIDTNRKGMDVAQSFGASSSYARKYALNGLFLIDDTKDPDTMEPPKKAPKATPTPQPAKAVTEKKVLTNDQFESTQKATKAQIKKVLEIYDMSLIQKKGLQIAYTNAK